MNNYWASLTGIPTCTAAGVSDGFGFSALMSLGVDPNMPTSQFCDVAPIDQCPSPAGTFVSTNLIRMDAPIMLSSGNQRCHYYASSPACGRLFPNLSQLLDSQLQSVPSMNQMGDVSCSTQISSGTCPTASNTDVWVTDSSDMVDAGVRQIGRAHV